MGEGRLWEIPISKQKQVHAKCDAFISRMWQKKPLKVRIRKIGQNSKLAKVAVLWSHGTAGVAGEACPAQPAPVQELGRGSSQALHSLGDRQSGGRKQSRVPVKGCLLLCKMQTGIRCFLSVLPSISFKFQLLRFSWAHVGASDEKKHRS